MDISEDSHSTRRSSFIETGHNTLHLPGCMDTNIGVKSDSKELLESILEVGRSDYQGIGPWIAFVASTYIKCMPEVVCMSTTVLQKMLATVYTINWKILELKIFHKIAFHVKKFHSNGQAKTLAEGRLQWPDQLTSDFRYYNQYLVSVQWISAFIFHFLLCV